MGCNNHSRTRGAEAMGLLGIGSQPRLPSESQASLDWRVNFCVKRQAKKQTQGRWDGSVDKEACHQD